MIKLLLDWLFNRNCDACGSWRGLQRGEPRIVQLTDGQEGPRTVSRRIYQCRNCGVQRTVDKLLPPR